MEGRRPGFFSILKERYTYYHMIYLLLTLPLGILYVSILLLGLILGIVLSVIWIGIPLLLAFVSIAKGFMSFERRMSGRLLHIYIEPDIPSEPKDTIWGKLKDNLSEPTVYKGIAYLFLKLPLGILGFIIGTLFLFTVLIFFIIPVFYFFLTNKFAIQQAVYSNVLFNPVTAMLVAIVFIILGVVVMVLSLHAINFISRTIGKFAAKMLGHKSEDLF